MSVSELELRRRLESAGLEDMRLEHAARLRESLYAESSLPSSFKLHEVRETEDRIIAVGEQEELCFFKTPRSISPNELAETTACFERYAPAVLTAARCYRLHGSHIVWLGDFNSQGPRRTSAEDVVLILRRLPEASRLSTLLADGEKRTAKLSRVLAFFFKSSIERERYRAALEFAENRQRLFRALSSRIDKVQDGVRARMSRLAETQALSLLESVSFLRSSLAHNERAIAERGASGFVGECHGALRSERIYIEDLLSTRPRISCLDWLPRTAPQAYADRVCDAAGLCLDLYSKGFTRTAQRLEASLVGAKDRTVRRFYLVLRLLELYLQNAVTDDGLLRRALGLTLDLEQRRCAVVVDGASDARRSELMEALRDFSGFHMVQRPDLPSVSTAPEIELEQSILRARSALSSGVSIIVDGGRQVSQAGRQLLSEALLADRVQSVRLSGRMPLSTELPVMVQLQPPNSRYIYAGAELPSAEAALVALRAFRHRDTGI